MFNFFEQPWTLLFVSVVVLFIVLRSSKLCLAGTRLKWLALPVLLAVIGVGLEFFIETDMEKINAVIAAAVSAVETEDSLMLEGIISADYRDSFHRSKKHLITHCRARFSEPLIEKCITRIVSMEKSRQNAAVVLTARVVFDKRSFISQDRPLTLVKLKIEFKKQADKNWYISRTEILEIDKQPVGWEYVSGVKSM